MCSDDDFDTLGTCPAHRRCHLARASGYRRGGAVGRSHRRVVDDSSLAAGSAADSDRSDPRLKILKRDSRPEAHKCRRLPALRTLRAPAGLSSEKRKRERWTKGR